MRPGQVHIHCLQHLFGGMGTGHGQHLGMLVADALGIGAQAAGHDDLAVGLECFADGL
jgi:hypothetical protein